MAPDPMSLLLDQSIRQHVFLSPHFDDVPFSCGGTLALLASHGVRPFTLVMATGSPDSANALTDFATGHHVMWGLHQDAIGSMAGRLAEEHEAAEILDMDVHLLPFQDAIYRGDRYQGNDRLFGNIAKDERDLPDRIADASLAALRDIPKPVRWYLPLAVGGHVDHQLVHAAGALLARSGDQLWYFGDQPYSLDSALWRPRLQEIRIPDECVDVGVGPVWNQRIDAVMAYRSQLASAFGYVGVGNDREQISNALAACWRDGSGSGPVERFWIAP